MTRSCESSQRIPRVNPAVAAFYTVGLGAFSASAFGVHRYGFDYRALVFVFIGLVWVAGAEVMRRWIDV